MNKFGGEPWGCCAFPRIWSWPRGTAHCRGAGAGYQATICEVISDKLRLKGIAEWFCRQSDSWFGIREQICGVPDPLRQRKLSELLLHLTALALLSLAEVTTASSIVTTVVFLRVVAINP